MFVDMSKGYDYVYSCNDCGHIDRVRERDVTLSYSCSDCGDKSEMIGIVNNQGQALYLSQMLEAEKQIVLDGHKELLSKLEKIGSAWKKFNESEEKSKRVRELEHMCQGLLKSMRRTKERMETVSDTSNKSLSLLETLTKTKPEAVKTIDALVDIVKQSDKEASTRYKSYNEKKAKYLDKLIELNKLKTELSGE
jgi:hypothetical protein